MSGRRKFLIGAAGLAGAAGLTAGFLRSHRPRPAPPPEPPLPPDPAFPNPLRLPGSERLFGIAEARGSFTLTARAIEHEIIPGRRARALAYEMELADRALLNPVLRARTGTALRIKFWNALEETSIIHWHGFHVDSNNDGHPNYAVPGGAIYDYQFTVANRAGTYWYHPHPHHLTGKQLYGGLASFFIVEDDEELALQKALDLKLGEADVPLLLQDRRLDDNGGFSYAPGDTDRFHGYFGNETLINWTRRPHFHAATRIHRFRILNGSNARIYRLAFRQGGKLLDFTLIGTDGGLLDRPRVLKEAFLSPAERVDVLLDLRGAARGDAITLVSLPFDAMHAEMRSAPAGHAHEHEPEKPAPGAAVPDGAEMELMRIRVASRVVYDRAVPQTLSRIAPPAESPYSPRLIVLDQANGRWRINGATYDPAATPITVRRDTVETWDFRNVQPAMPHPMHIHGFLSRVISRTGSPEQQRRLAVTDTGLAATDLGWKDTVLAWPGETVRIVTDFSHSFRGDQVYMVHCHNLEHADADMMLNLKVAG